MQRSSSSSSWYNGRFIISEEGLTTLQNYKYQSGGYSAFDNLLNPFWEAVVGFLPLWLAPNLVTLLGTCLLGLQFVVMQAHTTNLRAHAPAWVSLLSAFCLWAYNTLDAIDGKQARRTGASSPLGQLFDHGCDALGTIIITVTIASVIQLGATLQGYLFMAVTIVGFTLAQWEEYYTHRMRTNVPGVGGVTEGAYLMILLCVINAFVSPSFWVTPIVLSVSPASFMFWLSVCTVGWACICFTWNTVITHGRPDAFIMLLPMLSVFSGGYSITSNQAEVFGAYPLMYVMSVGLSLALIATKITVFGMCRVPVPFFEPVAILQAVVTLNTLFGVAPDLYVLCIVLAAVVLLYGTWVLSTIHQITRKLGISCLTITKKQ